MTAYELTDTSPTHETTHYDQQQIQFTFTIPEGVYLTAPQECALLVLLRALR